MMRLVFMGSPEFAVSSLEKLHAGRHQIVAVVSGADKRRGRGNRLTPTPVKARALQLSLPVIEADDLHDPGLEEKLKSLKPDLFVVVAFRILPESLLAIPANGSINLHASLLPKYRGAAPIHRAIMNGERETGCTVFFLNNTVDTGRIVSSRKIDIGPDETTGELYERLKILGSDLVAESVNHIETGDYILTAQDDTLATPAPKIFKDDARIDFNMPAAKVHNMVRAMNPFPGAWTLLDGQQFKIFRTRYPVDVKCKTGHITISGNRVFIGCRDGAVELQEVQAKGRSKMNAVDFFNGYKGDMRINGPKSDEKKKSG